MTVLLWIAAMALQRMSMVVALLSPTAKNAVVL
jgi:hypothetical protein